jgi:hypothetical protein
MRSLSACCIAVAAVGAVGCGGGTTHDTPAVELPARTQIEQSWTAFFNGSTPADEKVKLLQNGDRFAALVKAEAQSPLAKQTKATVAAVQRRSPTRANVVFTIWLAGKPALKDQVGLAVRTAGVWQVSDRSFCALLALQGQSPAACPRR